MYKIFGVGEGFTYNVSVIIDHKIAANWLKKSCKCLHALRLKKGDVKATVSIHINILNFFCVFLKMGVGGLDNACFLFLSSYLPAC